MQSHSFLLILLLSAAGAASGQQLAIPKKNFDSIQLRDWASRGTFSHATTNGKVYIMPFDHMRCLVPDMRKVSPMAIVKPPVPENMPNGFRPMPRKREDKD